jgi:drug/metabolite transporter (DMT)-like permease
MPSAPAVAGLGLLLVSTLCWGLAWPLAKIVVGELGVWNVRLALVAVGTCGLLAIAGLRGDRLLPPGARWGQVAFIGAMSTTGWGVLSTYALVLMAPGRAAILAYTMPLWAAIFGWLALGIPVRRRELLGLALGLAAIAVLLASDALAMGAAPYGPILIVMAAMCWAAGTVAIKAYRGSLSTLPLAAWQTVIGGLPIVGAALVVESPSDFLGLSPAAAWSLAFWSLSGAVAGVWAWYRVVQILPPHVAAIGILGTPILGLLSSAAVFGDTIGGAELTALALVVAALVAVLAPSSPVQRPRSQPRMRSGDSG